MKNLGIVLVFIGLLILMGAVGTSDFETFSSSDIRNIQPETPMLLLIGIAIGGLTIMGIGVHIANLPNKED